MNFPLEKIKLAIQILQSGGLVGMPTETVYGLAGDGLSPEALAKIFEAKKRPFFDPLILHVASLEGALALCQEFPKPAQELAEAFWPGPLTLVLPKRPHVPDLATSGLPSVAIRIPQHPVAQQLLQHFAGPLAAPSANRFGRISPTTAQAVREELGEAVPLVLDGGPCQVGLESTVISFTGAQPQILRLGGIPFEALQAKLPSLILANTPQDQPASPGQILHHYAPQTPLYLYEEWEELPKLTSREKNSYGLLYFPRHVSDHDSAKQSGFSAVACLSDQGDLSKAAAQFFQKLRELDHLGLETIWAQRLPPHGLGLAMNERLARARAFPR